MAQTLVRGMHAGGIMPLTAGAVAGGAALPAVAALQARSLKAASDTRCLYPALSESGRAPCDGTDLLLCCFC
eukprot:4169413-Pleurochrysis_carterae.AAC.1